MKTILYSSLFTLCLFLPSLRATPPPSPDNLLQTARLHPTAHPMTLSAKIRGAEEPLPLTLKIEKKKIEYQLQDPEESLILLLGPKTFSLSEKKEGNLQPLDHNKRYQEIRQSGVSYDDLSLSFLYWPNPQLLKEVTLRGEKASLIELNTPSPNEGPYKTAHLWIDQRNGAPLRMEGFNQDQQLIKRFEIVSAQKINGLWMLKEMRIETFDPETKKVIQRRYLDISPSTSH